jgi:hypothetical protein
MENVRDHQGWHASNECVWRQHGSESRCSSNRIACRSLKRCGPSVLIWRAGRGWLRRSRSSVGSYQTANSTTWRENVTRQHMRWDSWPWGGSNGRWWDLGFRRRLLVERDSSATAVDDPACNFSSWLMEWPVCKKKRKGKKWGAVVETLYSHWNTTSCFWLNGCRNIITLSGL